MILAHNTPIVNKYVNSVSFKLSFYSYTYTNKEDILKTKSLVSKNTWEIPQGTFEVAYVPRNGNNIKLKVLEIKFGPVTYRISE